MKTYSLCSIAMLAGGAVTCAQDAPLPPTPLVSVDPLPDVQARADRYFVDLRGGCAFPQDTDMPGMLGAVLEVGVRGQTWKILHEGFVSFGYYEGSDDYSFAEARDRFGIEAWHDDRYRSTVRREVESMPLMIGYRFSVPLGRTGISLYAGARYGISFFSDKFVQPSWCECCNDDYWDDGSWCGEHNRKLTGKSVSKGSFAIDGGVKMELSDSVELVLGYEYYRIGSAKPWHIVQLGVTKSF